MHITLVTGVAGAIQGWGDMPTTRALANALNNCGKQTEILFVNELQELMRYLEETKSDLIWSCLYHVCGTQDYIDIPIASQWVQEILEQKQIAYVGSSANSLKTMLDKHLTNQTLQASNLPVPDQWYVESGDELDDLQVRTPCIVKPCFGSESTGIDESSVVNSEQELRNKVTHILSNYSQPVVIEEYLPGSEFTVLVLGNGDDCRLHSIENIVDNSCYQHYPIVTNQLKLKNGIAFRKPVPEIRRQAEHLAYTVACALDCRDHVRIDMRMDADGQLKVIDVNGIPGMNPQKSRSLVIQELYYPRYNRQENFSRLTNATVDSALDRYAIQSTITNVTEGKGIRNIANH